MKKYIFLFLSLCIVTACSPTIGELSLNTQELNIEMAGGERMVTVTSNTRWSILKSDDSEWCNTSLSSGKGNASVKISVAANEGRQRIAELTFSANGSDGVVLRIIQAGNGTDEYTVPDPASGITVEPALPDADQACTIKFNPVSGNPLYDYTGELYAHLGVVVEGEWQYVVSEWGSTAEKVHFTKVADNSWELKLEPSVREYFSSGETPVNMIAIIVRDAEGNVKSHDSDQFCSVVDNKYKYEDFVAHEVVEASLPEGVRHGINYNDDGSVTFVLYEKDKANRRYDYCYIVGDWNDWERVAEGAMKRDTKAGCWWITLDGFDPDVEYRFQYRLGNPPSSDIRISDPYTEIVYDQWNDQYIDGVPAFPEGAKSLISAFQINRPAFSWTEFQIEDRNDLIIYEMLFRDFTSSQNIAGALAELDYIENLGVNAIELMPVQEFDANLSWGYNPNHWFALDKYYGTRQEYKEFIDECHKRGIAVILDVVYNHATGSHPWAKMYWNASANATLGSNPWFNVVPTHPFNVYHDMNHENAMVRDHVKRSLEYLLTEYNVDGFRFDLSKGFTQNFTDPDVEAWGKLDESRVAILKDYADHIWSVNEDALVILEHLAEPDEEEILARHGMQLWNNVNSEYRTAVAGGVGKFDDMYSSSPFGGYVGYMESHDEERLCFGVTSDKASVTWGVIGIGNDWNNDKKMTADGVFVVVKNVEVTATDRFKIRMAGEWNDAYNYGASEEKFALTVGEGYVMINGASSKDMYFPAAGTYDIYFCPALETIWLMEPGKRPAEPQIDNEDAEEALTVAMRRAGASAAFFLTVPGPKMIWQFGEIGYDYSINHNDRTGEKPVVTDEYMADPARKALYETYAALIKFRRENSRFFDEDADFKWDPSAAVKTITCTVDGKAFHVVGNFGKAATDYAVPEGNWTDYMSDEQIAGDITLKQGEFRLLLNF